MEGANGIPTTIVAKWSAAGPGTREARFLGEIGRRLGIPLPSLLGAFSDATTDRALILMDDIAPARQGDIFVGASPEDAAAVADQQATFHSVHWGRTTNPAVAWLPEWEEAAPARAARMASALPRFLEEHGDRLPPRALAAAERLPGALGGIHEALRAAPRTVIHADLHGDNLLFRPDGTPVILDWTDASLGPAAADFGRLLVEVLLPPQRRTLRASLEARYLEALAARGIHDYGLDRLREDADRVALVLFAASIRWAGGPEPLDRSHPRLERIVRGMVDNAAAAIADSAER